LKLELGGRTDFLGGGLVVVEKHAEDVLETGNHGAVEPQRGTSAQDTVNKSAFA
jgi:hypothetical protein